MKEEEKSWEEEEEVVVGGRGRTRGGADQGPRLGEAVALLKHSALLPIYFIINISFKYYIRLFAKATRRENERKRKEVLISPTRSASSEPSESYDDVLLKPEPQLRIET